MNFVDEENGPLLHVGEERQEVFGSFQGRSARHDQRNVQFSRQAGSKGRFPEARRPVEQDVPQRLAALAGRIDDDIQPFDHIPLAHHVLDALRAQAAIEFFIAVVGGGDYRFAGHGTNRSVVERQVGRDQAKR
jgi:hypothetical protein